MRFTCTPLGGMIYDISSWTSEWIRKVCRFFSNACFDSVQWLQSQVGGAWLEVRLLARFVRSYGDWRQQELRKQAREMKLALGGM
mmetsp:Transcript_102073/g.187061  ORF Transcript_102073/g.187061 Transcript_102073/m.187061 type:complete len:85 (-) Transcript_102073:28-282(-)